MTDEERIINRLQNLAIEKCLNMENCQDIADVYEKHFCKKSLANGSQKEETLCISCGNQERTIDDTGRCDSCRRELYERVCWMCDFD